jgi:hypothetical protein
MKTYLLSCGKRFWYDLSICSNKKGKWRQSINSIRLFLLISLSCLSMFILVGFQISSAQDGVFTDSGQNLGNLESDGVALGDLDGDGDLDAFIANGAWYAGGRPNKVWLNDGNGNFTDSAQALGSSGSFVVALGDVDSDGDLDALIVNHPGTNNVWLNDGNGNFADSGQALGSSYFGGALGDVDGDGDLDAYITGASSPDKVWLNDGNGNFTDSGQQLGVIISSRSQDAALGDLDGDGDLDAFIVKSGANKVFLNTEAPAATYDATGTWTYSTSNNYLDPGQDPLCVAQPNETATCTITQTGNRVTIVASGETYNGYVRGADYTASSRLADIGGTASLILAFTLSSSTSGSGSVYWFWLGPDIPPQCSGGSDLSLAKGAGGAGGGGGGGGGCLIGTLGYGTRR